MIISPPFLPAPDGDDDVTFVSRAMPDATDFAPGSGGAPLGSYPLTTALTWHNGLHVKAPLDAQQNPLPVRAIADGIVVFHCAPKKRNTAASDPQNYNAFDITAGWTDNGIVIIRHVTDIGASDADSTTVTYYSVYMHLSSIEKAAEAGSRIWRKDALGSAGRIMGHEHQIHFEICLSPSELQKLVGSGRSTTWTDPATTPTADGRTDAVFGSVYVFLPQGTPTSATRPTNHLRRINPGPSAATDHLVPNTLGAAQWVEIRYQRGSGTIRSYRATDDVNKRWRVGDAIGQPLDEPEFEYSLYAEANRRHNSLDANAQASSSPSGWYELLRFARNLGPDRLPADAAHWRRIPAESGTVWADLNAPGTFKFSDADFPAFKGWQFFDDDTSHDNQRCDSVELKRLIRDPQQPETIRKREVLARRLGNTQVRESLKRAICKFPTEWDRNTILQRYDWLKVDEEFRLDKGKEWDDFKAHCEAISFDRLPQEYKEAVWHIHPRTFISHMRQCDWLSTEEFAHCIPRRSQQGDVSWANALDRAKKHSASYNLFIRKFSPSSRSRYLHNMAQSLLETDLFATLIEYGKGKKHPYGPFYGRGFHQLTWAGNFKAYGAFRCLPDNLSGTYVDPRITSTSQHSSDSGGTSIRWSPRYDPSIVEMSTSHAASASGHYWVAKRFRGTSNINRVCDLGVNGTTVGFICWLINGGSNGYAARQQFAAYLSNVLLDDPPRDGFQQFTFPTLQSHLTEKFPISGDLQNNANGIVNYARQCP